MNAPEPAGKPDPDRSTGPNAKAKRLYQELRDGQIDRDAFVAEIFWLAHQPLIAYIYHQLWRYRVYCEDADDLFQKVMMRFTAVIDNRTLDLSARKLFAWLFEVAKNLVIDTCRKNSSEQKALTEQSAAESSSQHPADTWRWMARRTIAEALASLPDELSYALDMCCYKGSTQEEVADLLGVSRWTVQRYIRKAKKLLRDNMQLRELIEANKSAGKERS